jgi:hypothetical protein
MTREQELDGGNMTVYTGPKGGKFVVKNGKKQYLDRKSLNDNRKYVKPSKGK